jgi:hypothetical protein
MHPPDELPRSSSGSSEWFRSRLPGDAVRILEADARDDPRFAALQDAANRIKVRFHLEKQ